MPRVRANDGPSGFNPVTGRSWEDEYALTNGPVPTAASQAQALASPRPITVDTPTNPYQVAAIGSATAADEAAARYEAGLAAGTNEEITRELGRARDEISLGMKAEGESAMSRGADPSLFRSRALAAGKRDLHALQGTLADKALGRREGAIRARTEAAGGRTAAASAAAGEQRLMHLGTLAQRLAENRALVEQAEVQARLQAAPYERLMQMMQTVATNRDAFTNIGGATPIPAAPVGGLGRSMRPSYGRGLGG